MKTINWQTKALTLFIAAAALWLIAACTNADTDNEPPPNMVATEVPTQSATEVPTEEASKTPTPPPTLEPPPILCKENTMTLTAAQQAAFLEKHKALIERQRGLLGYEYGQLKSVQADGSTLLHTIVDGTPKMGLSLMVAHPANWVHRDRGPVSEEDIIPDCLDGVPVMRWVLPEGRTTHGWTPGHPDYNWAESQSQTEEEE